jgi:hypothetical protein
MSRLLPSFSKSSKNAKIPIASSHDGLDDDESKSIATVVQDMPLQPPTLKFKRLDFYYSGWSRQWKYKNMNAKVSVENRSMKGSQGDNDPWKEFCFVVVRTMPDPKDGISKPTFKVVVKSPYILKACKDVIKAWTGISWNSEPLELEPEILLTFLPDFTAYRDRLVAKKDKSDEDKHVLSSSEILLDWLHSDYRTTISTINNLVSHGEIKWECLYAIFVPRSTLIARCAITGELSAYQLKSVLRSSNDCVPTYQLICESFDLIDKPISNAVSVGRVETIIHVKFFKGTVKITSLDAYPIQYHSTPTELRRSLIERGRKWISLTGIQHKQYKGIAALQTSDKIVKHNIDSRVMLDRVTFKKLNNTYRFPSPVVAHAETNGVRHPPLPLPGTPRVDEYGTILPAIPFCQSQRVQATNQDEGDDIDLSDDELILTSAVVYGFSLTDKIWLEFNVQNIKDVAWNENAFDNLVIPSGRKALLQSLVEAHHQGDGFDDFIKGKGQGLVINLFGPPGVGKTFSAEATSEHVKRPLYIVGAGELGTKAIDLNLALERVFDLATSWKAIILIDEADVFLERRSLHDIERNAMVAVFLRHLEYYRGIMFLTTNRVKAFDEACLSRIHVALHFKELSESSRAQVWAAFVGKVGVSITQEQLQDLAKRNVNGRQIKNAARTAQSLAVGRGEQVAFSHFVETLDAMNEFTVQFEAIQAA